MKPKYTFHAVFDFEGEFIKVDPIGFTDVEIKWAVYENGNFMDVYDTRAEAQQVCREMTRGDY